MARGRDSVNLQKLFPRLTGLTIELDDREDLHVLDLDTLLRLNETLAKFCALHKLKWHVNRSKNIPLLSMPSKSGA
ncbi:hypothetical protein VNI00_014009 [Paramarasmius palmivorus]|uniref:Uncharacterized protein n=1 Tax=Paramarasmius palmivorus TaxID=297713 RepID=A0AAW0BVU4_9AGAR